MPSKPQKFLTLSLLNFLSLSYRFLREKIRKKVSTTQTPIASSPLYFSDKTWRNQASSPPTWLPLPPPPSLFRRLLPPLLFRFLIRYIYTYFFYSWCANVRFSDFFENFTVSWLRSEISSSRFCYWLIDVRFWFWLCRMEWFKETTVIPRRRRVHRRRRTSLLQDLMVWDSLKLWSRRTDEWKLVSDFGTMLFQFFFFLFL